MRWCLFHQRHIQNSLSNRVTSFWVAFVSFVHIICTYNINLILLEETYFHWLIYIPYLRRLLFEPSKPRMWGLWMRRYIRISIDGLYAYFCSFTNICYSRYLICFMMWKQDFINAIQNIRPSVSKDSLITFVKWSEQFGTTR